MGHVTARRALAAGGYGYRDYRVLKEPMMNRFFSKLDLRDIRIDPKSSRFPPDAEQADDDCVDQVGGESSGQVVAENDRGSENAASSSSPAAATDRPVRFAPVMARPAARVESVVPVPEVAGPAGSDAARSITDELCDDVLKVSARSRPSAVAGAIAGVVRESGRAEVQAIGAGATNQAVKAVAIARDYLQETGIDAVCVPAFIDVTVENEDRTAIRLVIEPR